MLNELYKVVHESKNTNNSSWTDVEYKNIHTNLKELILFLKKYINVLNEHEKWEGSIEDPQIPGGTAVIAALLQRKKIIYEMFIKKIEYFLNYTKYKIGPILWMMSDISDFQHIVKHWLRDFNHNDFTKMLKKSLNKTQSDVMDVHTNKDENEIFPELWKSYSILFNFREKYIKNMIVRMNKWDLDLYNVNPCVLNNWMSLDKRIIIDNMGRIIEIREGL